MESNIIDRVEIQGVAKKDLLFKILAAISLVVVIIKLVTQPGLLRGEGNLLDYTVFLLPIIFFLSWKQNTNKKGQFIEWKEQEIVYNCKGIQGVAPIANIEAIVIAVDQITINLKGNGSQLINIEDFTEYENRKRIKENFERLQENLK